MSATSSYIRTAFQKLPVVLDTNTSKALRALVLKFEMTRDHSLVLNSQAIGTRRVLFTQSDQKAVFDLVGVDPDEMTALIGTIPTIDPDHKVASNTFNLLCIYVMHVAHNHPTLKATDKDLIKFNIAKLMNYRFFTSFTNRAFKYLADEETMMMAISQLSRKFDIITLGTWKAVLEARSMDLISSESLHYKTIERFIYDKDVTYMLTDAQNRIRDRIKNVMIVYYDTHKEGAAIATYSNVREIDGEKMMTDNVSLYDTMIANLTREILNPKLFHDKDTEKLCAGIFQVLRPSMIRDAVDAMCQRADAQYQTPGEFDMVQKIKGKQIIVGVRALITAIIQRTYRNMRNSGVVMDSASVILLTTKNIYSSSRIADPEILQIKDSVTYFVDSIKTTQRESTKASLRIALIMYIIAKTIKYI